MADLDFLNEQYARYEAIFADYFKRKQITDENNIWFDKVNDCIINALDNWGIASRKIVEATLDELEDKLAGL